MFSSSFCTGSPFCYDQGEDKHLNATVIALSLSQLQHHKAVKSSSIIISFKYQADVDGKPHGTLTGRQMRQDVRAKGFYWGTFKKRNWGSEHSLEKVIVSIAIIIILTETQTNTEKGSK